VGAVIEPESDAAQASLRTVERPSVRYITHT
jgi:hypothetical protein